MKKLKTYVDGSYDSARQIYGSGCLILNDNNSVKKEITYGGAHPELISMRNVTGEIIASLLAIQYAIENGYEQIDIFYDYEGIEMWADKKWKRNKQATKKYSELVEQYRKQIKISFHKVKAHSSDTYNELADGLAKQGIINYINTNTSNPTDDMSELLLSDTIPDFNLFTFEEFPETCHPIKPSVNTPAPHPHIFSFEGIEGCGKSTVIQEVYQTLLNMGYDVILTREPAGTNLGKTLKKILLETEDDYDSLTEFLMFLAARRDHYLKVIKPALEKGQIVLCDRFIHSSIVYQGLLGDCSGVKLLNFINEGNDLCLHSIQEDKLTAFYLSVPVDIALKRMNSREKADKNDRQPPEFHKRIKEGFDYVFKTNKNCHVIDASRTVKEISNDIINFIQNEIEEEKEKNNARQSATSTI